ncbi:MAG: hypothetical protein AAFX56_04845 [Pseudomonadota bacterium]
MPVAAADEAREDGSPEEVSLDNARVDMAFLEYLGSWEDSDEEWVWFATNDEDAADARSRDDEASGDEPRESEVEGQER